MTGTALEILDKKIELVSFNIWSKVPVMIQSTIFLTFSLPSAFGKGTVGGTLSSVASAWLSAAPKLTVSRFKTTGDPLLLLRIPEKVKIISKRQ